MFASFVFSLFFLDIVATLYTSCIPYFIYNTFSLSIKKKCRENPTKKEEKPQKADKGVGPSQPINEVQKG